MTHSWVLRRPADVQARYRTLFRLEESFSPDGEYAFLIGPACTLLEAEIDMLLTVPARAVADQLIAVLGSGNKDDRRRADILADWASGKRPATIGTASVILLALRRGLEGNAAALTAFLDENFQPGYLMPLAANGLARGLDFIRENYRNPACHGYGSFNEAAYEEFARLAIAHRRFADWQSEGAVLDKQDSKYGVLHHHLAFSRRLPAESVVSPAGNPIERLLGLAAPRNSPLSVRVEVQSANEARTTRDLKSRPVHRERPFRLGEAVQLVYEVGQECHVTILDIGTKGALTVVLPNAWRRDTRTAAGGVHYLPALDRPEFEFELMGRPGRERIFALATVEPIPLQPPGNEPFRSLTSTDFEQLFATVQRLAPTAWAAGVCQFEVLGGP
jgi:hypothetical protein